MAEPSTRAKWRALRSARSSTLKKCLTGIHIVRDPPVTLGNASACLASTSAKKADGVCVRCHKKRAQATNVRCVECQAYHSAHKKKKRADLKRGINLALVDWRYGGISPTIRVRSARLTIFILRIALSSSTMKAKNTAGSRHLHPTENVVGNGDR
jgi:hypothetical protein